MSIPDGNVWFHRRETNIEGDIPIQKMKVKKSISKFVAASIANTPAHVFLMVEKKAL